MAEQLANNAASTLSAAITTVGATSCTVANGTVFPATGNFRILIDSELILVGARSGNTLSSLTRGAESTTAATHLNAAPVTHVLTKGGLDQYLSEYLTANALIGKELAYTEFTSNVAVTGTTEAGATSVVSAGAVTFDGSAVLLEFFSGHVRHTSATVFVDFVLYDGSSSIGLLGTITTSASANAGVAVRLARRFTPSAAAHTYSVRAFVGAGTATVEGGAGGSGARVPGFIRITKV